MAQATLAQKQLYVAEHCLDKEFLVEEVLVVTIGYVQGVFPVPFSNTPHLLCFWRADMLIDHLLAIKGDQHHFAQ